MLTLALCDIKGPLPFHGLPPFFLTGAVLLLTTAGYKLIRYRKRLYGADATPANAGLPTPADTLEKLADDYRHGGLSDDVLFCRLAALITSRLAGQAGQTSDEVLLTATAAGILTADSHKVASGLLQLCERVKFARYDPSTMEIAMTLESASVLLTAPTGERP